MCLNHATWVRETLWEKPIEGDGKFRRQWDVVQVLLLLYVAVMVPLRTGFDDRGLMMEPLSALWWMELMVDLYFSEFLVQVQLLLFVDPLDMRRC